MAGTKQRKQVLSEAIEALKSQGDKGGVEFAAVVSKLKDPSSLIVSDELYGELEIEFRTALSKSLKIQNGTPNFTENIIKLSVDYALAEADIASKADLKAPTTGKLPFLLFEDLIEGSKLENDDSNVWSSRRAWELLETYTVILTETEDLFSKGKLSLLRFCNGLLRRLSKTLDTEWCGKILMFLTASFPLSEKSALNINGKLNILNITSFEDKEGTCFDKDELEIEEGEEKDDVLNDEENKENKDKEGEDEDKDEEESDDDEDDEEDYSKMKSKRNKTKFDSLESASGSIDYDLYQSLWSLQSWLSDPFLSLSSSNEWLKLISSTKAVLNAFEFYVFKEHELAQGAQSYQLRRKGLNLTCDDGSSSLPMETSMMEISSSSSSNHGGVGNDVDGDGENMALNCKYLTTSRLLRLQLVDPEFRMHIVTQLSILFNHIKEFALLNYTNLLSDKTKDISDDDKKILNPDVLFIDIKKIEKRLNKLLKFTPPNGEAYCSFLSHVMKSELSWTEWKDKNKCKAFEKYPTKSNKMNKDSNGEDEMKDGGDVSQSKRKRVSILSPYSVVDESSAKVIKVDLDSNTIGSIKKTPSLESHMEWYIECEDPASGVEKEYHAKLDNRYCWRATRLIMTQKPALLFDSVKEGVEGELLDLAVKAIKGNNTDVVGEPETKMLD